MTHDTPPPAPAPAARRRRLGPTPLVIGVGAVALIAIAAAYGARNLIARDLVVGWLRERGVTAQVEITGLSLDGVNARVVAGPAERPDFAVESSQISYRLTGPWSGEALGVRVRSVRLVRPRVRARLADGALSFGALDPVIAELRKRPRDPDVPQPLIRIESGRLSLDSAYGHGEIDASARLDNGRLLELDAATAPTTLKADGISGDLGPGILRLRAKGQTIEVDLDLGIARLLAPGFSADGAHARLSGQIPYPDLTKKQAAGAVTLRLVADAETLSAGAGTLRVAKLDGDIAGRASGWIDTLALAATATARLKATSADAGGLRTRDIAVDLTADDLDWRRTGGDRVRGEVRLAAALATASQGPLRLQGLKADFKGPAGLGPEGAHARLSGRLSARGGLANAPATLASDATQIAAVKRAMRAFTIEAPGVAAALDGRGWAVDLTAPAHLRDAAGAHVTLTAAPGRALFRNGRSSFDAAAAGGGLPQIRASVDGMRAAPGGLTAPLRLAVRTDFEPARGGALDVSGDLRVNGGAVVFTSRQCAAVSATRLEFGANSIDDLKGQLCPGARPLFEQRNGAWRVRAQVRAAAAQAGFLQGQLSEGSGAVEFGIAGGELTAAANLESGKVRDAAPMLRFNPVRISGPAILRDGVWQAAVAVADDAGRKLGEAQLTHDTRTGVGEVNLDTEALAFAEGGLQPADLSPLAAALGAPVVGHAGFSGEITWSPDGVTSRGAASVPGLDFTSPFGPVRGLSGEVVFTSLIPLIAPAGQRLRADEVTAFAPFTDVKASLGIGERSVEVVDAEALASGGRLRIAALSLPLTPGAEWGGVLEIEGVQLKDLVESSPFGDRMDLTARVSGKVPFQVLPQGLRISGGELHAIEPGRLSIRREALTSVSADQPDAAAAAPNAFSDFAYQAMENLAFDILSAELNSLPGGRLGVLFRIKGEHRPAKPQQLRIGVGDLISRKFLERAQPLPSGTKVDLTLDTTLNLDQLLEDLADYRKTRSSGGVQTPGPNTAPETSEQTK